MALKSTIFRIGLQVSDMDRGHFATHELRLARHPSETDERMMVRLLAFALNADERLEFGPGIGADGEPDLVLKDLTGAIEHWIDVGLPDEREVRKASGRAGAVVVYIYGRGADIWWRDNQGALARLANVRVVEFSRSLTQALAKAANRNMDLSVTIQDGQFWIDAGDLHLQSAPVALK